MGLTTALELPRRRLSESVNRTPVVGQFNDLPQANDDLKLLLVVGNPYSLQHRSRVFLDRRECIDITLQSHVGSISFFALAWHYLDRRPIPCQSYLASCHLVLDDLKVRAMIRCFLCLIRQYYSGFYRLHLWT